MNFLVDLGCAAKSQTLDRGLRLPLCRDACYFDIAQYSVPKKWNYIKLITCFKSCIEKECA